MNAIAALVQYLKTKLPNIDVSTPWVQANATYPCITIYLITENDRIASETPWVTTKILQIDVWSKISHSQADTIADNIISALHSYNEPIEKIDRQQLFEEKEKIHRTLLKFELQVYLHKL